VELKEWKGIVDVLESFLPHYEKVNHFVTFFMLLRWRNKAARLANREDDVLEIGSGPGGFARLLEARNVFCLDPSPKMLLWSKQILKDNRYTFVLGTGENIPLDRERFDKVFCIFSFRDFLDRVKGSEELERVLKAGGTLIIVDILKPRSALKKTVMDIWIKYGTRLAMKILVPRAKRIWSKNPYNIFYNTYIHFETEEGLRAQIESAGFEDVRTENLGFGAYMLVATKPVLN
jgi:demethylmenaquinone methyltransferase/2-methoxy-6-polyprenyl-1,4-benzoquinol methylase